MHIHSLKTFLVAPPSPHRGGRRWVFLKLLTDEGIAGYGEVFMAPVDPRVTARVIEDVGERLVIGTNPFAVERLWRTLYTYEYAQHPDHLMMGVISAFEMACWDIIGKAVNQPIYNLLGGPYHERLRSYTYLFGDKGYMMRMDPQYAAERALAYVEQGFTAIKIDPLGIETLAAEQLSLEILHQAELVVKAVREAIGDRADILIGTHGQMTTTSAIRLARRLEPYDPLWFEEPVPPENRDEMARVARATRIPIATGERLSTKYEFRELLDKGAASILQMALGRVGGILEAKKIAGMAGAYYAQIAPHLYAGPIAGAAAIQLDVCSPNFLIQEGIEQWGGFHAEILKEPIRWEKGYIIPPMGCGLGVELNEEVAAKYPYGR